MIANPLSHRRSEVFWFSFTRAVHRDRYKLYLGCATEHIQPALRRILPKLRLVCNDQWKQPSRTISTDSTSGDKMTIASEMHIYVHKVLNFSLMIRVCVSYDASSNVSQ